ncbi:uncharacterized protein G6M90_00g108320 [Metarhizium brunneum]|uniref:Uncharacterized protein n=1 Tax=Metarhizium brunneum TaxID=500148 RepID=A0A7D5Z6K2_9HYPO|nr:hypothetical protein G6M90_00g108320 [Metarhizium brunneum]
MKNVVLVGLFLAGSTLAMPCNSPSSSQDKPATEVNSVNLDLCEKRMLEYLQTNSDGCKEIPCADSDSTALVLTAMIDCLIRKEPNSLQDGDPDFDRDFDCVIEASESAAKCIQEKPPSNSSTYRFDPSGKQVATDENLRVARQCSQQAIPGYKQCLAAGEQL